MRAACLLALVAALAAKISGSYPPPAVERIIADVDGGVDDMEALVLLLNADRQGRLTLEAIIVTEGITDHTHGVRNVFLLLTVINRLDIPVYLGAKKPLLQQTTPMGGYYGEDGHAFLHWDTPAPVHRLQSERAFDVVRRLVTQYNVTYVVTGPMTTLAVTGWLYPEVMTDLHSVYAMGGLKYNGVGEFNAAFDAEAMDMVVRNLHQKMVLITWEAGQTNSPHANWYKIVTVKNPAWRYMVRISDAVNQLLFAEHVNTSLWEHCDPIVPAVLLQPNLIRHYYHNALQVNVGRNPLRGVVSNSSWANASAVDVVLEIDYEAFMRLYVMAFEKVCVADSEHQCQDVD